MQSTRSAMPPAARRPIARPTMQAASESIPRRASFRTTLAWEKWTQTPSGDSSSSCLPPGRHRRHPARLSQSTRLLVRQPSGRALRGYLLRLFTHLQPILRPDRWRLDLPRVSPTTRQRRLQGQPLQARCAQSSQPCPDPRPSVQRAAGPSR